MSAQEKGRDPHESGNDIHGDPCAAGVHVFRGALVVLNSAGDAKPGVTATGLLARGVATVDVDNTDGDAGDLTVHTKSGTFEFANSADSDEITAAEILDYCYIVDDQTVAKTSGGATRSIAGIVVGVQANGRVDVCVGRPPANGDLLAANNLSDVNSIASARDNIASNRVWVHVGQVSTKAADSGVLRMPAMADGTLLKVKTVLNAALATADATLQAKIAGANAGSTTTGKATMTQSSSAAGDVDSATPLTTNVTMSENDLLEFVIGGGSTATATAEVYALIKY